jgi:uncharacterized protein YqjF (DUF2071 family)
LSAQWLDLVMLNYQVDFALLKGRVPAGTELDSFDGKTFVGLAGFRFLRTKLFGVLPLPFHTNFDEVNLRFYVRRRAADGDRRGVVFISEIVPKRAVAMLACFAYGENYSRHPMRHKISAPENARPAGSQCGYQFKLDQKWCNLHAGASSPEIQPLEGSVEQFITEHYWGYAARRGGSSIEYRVFHVPWRVWKSNTAAFEGDASSPYGTPLAEILHRGPTPHSLPTARQSSCSLAGRSRGRPVC